jgi:hypothetical protein
MIKLSEQSLNNIEGIIDWYNMQPKTVKDFDIYISKEWESVKISQKNKATINFFKDGSFSYDGQPKKACEVLCNIINDKSLLNSLQIILPYQNY